MNCCRNTASAGRSGGLPPVREPVHTLFQCPPIWPNNRPRLSLSECCRFPAESLYIVRLRFRNSELPKRIFPGQSSFHLQIDRNKPNRPYFRVSPVISPGEKCHCHQNEYNGCFLNAMCRGSRQPMSQSWVFQWNRRAEDCALLSYHWGMNRWDSFLKKRIRRISAIRKSRSPPMLAGKIPSASFLISFLLKSYFSTARRPITACIASEKPLPIFHHFSESICS